MSPAAVRQTIFDEIERVAKEQRVALDPFDDGTPLTKIGLDSLGFAILVARLEEQLGVDPFGTSAEAVFPVTVGELVAFYQAATG